jgi:hypothetical protein
MVEEGSIIKVYSASPISAVFESQIVGMKHRLKWIVIPNEKLFKKVKFSKCINGKLLERKIKTLLLSHNQCVLMHSSEIGAEEMKSIGGLFEDEALILSFENVNFSKLVNRIYFQLLIWHCETLLRKIEKDY